MNGSSKHLDPYLDRFGRGPSSSIDSRLVDGQDPSYTPSNDNCGWFVRVCMGQDDMSLYLYYVSILRYDTIRYDTLVYSVRIEL